MARINIEELKNLVFNSNLESVYDIQIFNVPEFLYEVADRLNKLIENMDYLLDEGMKNEVILKITEWFEDGTLAHIINEVVFSDLNKKIDDNYNELSASLETNKNYLLNRPSSNINLQRIGRKINYGENPNATTYNANGSACMLQGGCKIDNNTIAYMLWDNLNNTLNKNKLVVLNINTGAIVKEKEFTFGWCNSIDYVNGKLYVAERGNSQGNNGKIHVIDYATLNEINLITLNKNVNAISIFEDVMYVLEENTSTLFKYDLDGNFLNKSISLNIEQLYNQNILVTKDYIYLLSSQPSNLINVFEIEGNLVKSYNIPKYGGIYYVGEPQFLLPMENNDMVMGSVTSYFNEFNNQFFKLNLVTNVVEDLPVNNFANTLNVNSDVEYFNPNGDIGNEFTTINECSNLNIRNIILNGNNKNYKYTYITDNKKFIRVLYANFTEGVFAQYGDLSFNDCTFSYSINNIDLSSLHLRDIKVTLNNCSFDSKNNDYCINTERNVMLKIIVPKFLNYIKDVIYNSGLGNIIDFNNYENMPFIRHSNLKKYSLFAKGFINNFKPGSYSYNTDLSQSEIQAILDNCTRIKIVYLPFNNSTKTIELTRSSAQSYTFVETTVSSSSILVRHCKTQITLTSSGYTINVNNTTTFDGTTWIQQDATTNNTSDYFNTIRSIELIP